MIRGTTAQFKFKLPCNKGNLTVGTIKVWQPNNPNSRLPILKKLHHCSGSDDLPELCVSLTAEETARFSDKYKAKIQLRACHGGTWFGSKDILIPVYPMPDDIIDSDPIIPPEEEGWVIFDGDDIGS